MRNLKKLLAVIVAVCTILTFTVPAFAAEAASISADAQIAKDLGVLKGDSSLGVTDTYLAKGTTRIQAATLYLRLIGKEAAAYAATPATNFADADKAGYANGTKLLGYLKENPDLGWQGVSADKFDPQGAASAQMIYKVFLEALGYKTGTDFQYADTITFAAGKGLSKIADVTKLTNDDTATALVEALKATMADGKQTLAAKLVEANVIDKAAAEAAGLYATTISATAAQTGAKTITVTFNRALSATEKTAATFAVKNGLVAYTVKATWAADNKSVALDYAYNLFAGDYTITIGGIADPVKLAVVDEKVTKITIDNDYLPKATEAAIKFTVYNQFNEKMDNQVLSVNAYNANKGVSYTPNGDNEINLSGADKDNVVIITISHYATGVNVSKSVPVSDIANAKTLQFGAVQPLTGDTRISASKTGYKLPYTFADQYGKELKLPEYTVADADADTETIGNIKFMSSDAAIVDPDSFRVDSDGVLTFNTGSKDGTVIVSALVPATGAYATASIKVEAGAAVKTFTISNPGKLVAVGDTVTIPYVAVDTFGAPIALKDFDAEQADIKFVSSDAGIVTTGTTLGDFSFNGKHELVLKLGGNTGSVTIYPTVKGVLQNSITLDVKARAVPTRITGLKDVPTLFQNAASDDIKAENLVVIDQYNRPIDLGLYGTDTYTVAVAYDGASKGKVTLGGAAVIAKSTGTATLTGTANEGTENLVFTLKKNTADLNPAVTYKTSVQTIKDDNIVGYSLDTINTLYANADNTATSDHAITVKLLGKDASGNAVTMNQGIITSVTSTNTAIVNVAGTKIFSLKAGTSTVAIWKNGTKLAEATVTSKDEAPYAATAEFDKTSYDVTNGGGTVTIDLTVKDQYGIEITPVGTWTTSDAAKATVVGGVVTGHAVGTATISYVTNTGIVVSAEVSVN